MADIATDLKQRFDWAMYLSLEAYEVLPDGRSFERTDRDEYAIDVFKKLCDSVDAIPPLLIKATEELRAVEPELFEKLLAHRILLIGPDFSPTSAAEFVEVLNRIVQRDMAIPGL
jgi:hypothetical protein